jgi:hypothetical protein
VYADRQYPDRDTFISCVERIVERADTGEHLRMVLGSSALIVMADGTVTDAEAEFSRELRTLMADGGFEFRVDVDGSGGKLRVSVENAVEDDGSGRRGRGPLRPCSRCDSRHPAADGRDSETVEAPQYPRGAFRFRRFFAAQHHRRPDSVRSCRRYVVRSAAGCA